MAKFRKAILYFFILSAVLTLTACGQKKDESGSKQSKDEFQVLQTPLEDLESGLIHVMEETDLVPYYETQIAAKKQMEEEQKKAAQSAGQGEAPAPPPEKEYQPEPPALTNTLLTEVLQQENVESESQQQKQTTLPEKISIIWDDINTAISKIHQQWNDLQPQLGGVHIGETVLTDFTAALNHLTIAATTDQVMETLRYANDATGQFGAFMKGSKNPGLSPLYFIKYDVRAIVLDCANQDYAQAHERFETLKDHAVNLGHYLAEKKGKDQSDKLLTAVDGLKGALEMQDLNLIKVKAGVIIKTLVAAKEILST